MEDGFLFIEQCKLKTDLSKEDWKKLSDYANSSDYDIKYDICEFLASEECSESEEILVLLLSDEDNLIRASACEALCFSKSECTMTSLCKCLRDKDKIVRAYAALSIGDIRRNINTNFKETVEILKLYYDKEKNSWCKIAFARSLFLLGEVSYGEYLVEMINNRFYRNRSCSLNVIIELIEKYHIGKDIKNLSDVLNERIKIETALCVRESIDDLLKLL